MFVGWGRIVVDSLLFRCERMEMRGLYDTLAYLCPMKMARVYPHLMPTPPAIKTTFRISFR